MPLFFFKQWSRDYPIDVPATPMPPNAYPRYQKLSTGANGQKEDAASCFIRTFMIELSFPRAEHRCQSWWQSVPALPLPA